MATQRHHHTTPDSRGGLTIRKLGDADALAVRELAARDSTPVPEGELLGLEIEGRLLAMQELAEGGDVIADPFARTAEIRALLELRASQLRARGRRRAHVPHLERRAEHALHPLIPFARGS